MKIRISSLVLILIMGVLCGCASTNIHNMTSSSFSLEDDEQRIWNRCREIQDVFNKSGFLYEDKELNEYLTKLANSLLIEQFKRNDLSVEVKVVKDSAFNASMFPNGIMYVHTGLLANMDNEAQVAIVLSHELVHFINRHTLKSFRSIINKSAFFQTLSTLSLLAPGGGYNSLANIFIQVGFITSATGYSKELETESDTVGFDLFSKKYDISQASQAFNNLERELKEQKIKQPYFFSSHPSIKARIKNMQRLAQEYKQEGKQYSQVVNKDIYDQKIKQLLLDNAKLAIKMGWFKSAERSINRFLTLSTDNPYGYYWLGELFLHRAQKEDKEKAITYYKKAIGVDNHFALAHRALGIIYYKENLKAEAINEFETYLEFDPQAQDKEYINGYIQKLREKG